MAGFYVDPEPSPAAALARQDALMSCPLALCSPAPGPLLCLTRWVRMARSSPECQPYGRGPALLLVGVEGRVGEALALVLAEELAVTHADVVHLVARAASVHALPLLRGLLSLPVGRSGARGASPSAVAAPPARPGLQVAPPLPLAWTPSLCRTFAHHAPLLREARPRPHAGPALSPCAGRATEVGPAGHGALTGRGTCAPAG